MQPYELARAISDLPERYNAAKDLIGTNISAGRANKTAVIDHTGAYSYGMLAGRIERMALPTPSIFRQSFSVQFMQVSYLSRSTLCLRQMIMHGYCVTAMRWQ